jgi:hypothetical protein
MANTGNRTSAAVHSTLADRIRDEGSHKFRLRLATRRILPKIGIVLLIYVKVDMSKIPDYEGPAFPLSSPIAEVTATCTAL